MTNKKHKNTNYYIDATKYSSGVIETLEEKGGIDLRNYASNIQSNHLYYIDPITKEIVFCSKASVTSNLIEAFYTEIEPNKRLPKGEIYYYIIATLSPTVSINIKNTTDTRNNFDNNAFKSGNYFKTEFDAQIAANKIKDIFNNNK